MKFDNRTRSSALALLGLLLCLMTLSACPAHSAPTTLIPGTNPASPGPWLVYDIAVGEGMGSVYTKIGGAAFEVQISEDGGSFKRLWRTVYGRFNQWYPYALNLAPYAGKTVKIRLMTYYPDHRICEDYPYWGDPRIVVGPLVGARPPTEVYNFALTPIKTMGGLLPDGTVAPLDEPAQFFGYEGKTLVTPGMVNRKYSVMVYAGNNYITVAGKAQPGIFMGFDMSNDWRLRGADPDQTPYTGTMPPPAFAEWTVTLPGKPIAAALRPRLFHKSPRPSLAGSGPRPTSGAMFRDITFAEDRYRYQPGLVAEYDPAALTMRVNMGPKAERGWAFTGVETLGLNQATLAVKTTGRFTPRNDNSFAGLVVDYHTARGYQKRLWLPLGAGGSQRYDMRPGDWILDEASLSRSQRLTFQNQFVDLSGQIHNGQGTLTLPIARYAPPGWDGRVWLGAGVQDVANNQGLQVRLLGLKSYIPNPAIRSVADVSRSPGQFLTLKNGTLLYVFSRVNGAVCGIWDTKTGRRIVDECTDRYHQERRTSVSNSTERFDRVTGVTRLGGVQQGYVLICTNQGLPGVLIQKRYMLAPDHVLSKRVGFTTNDRDGFFLTWTSGTSLAPAFIANATFGGGLAPQKVVANGKVVTLSKDVKREQADNNGAPLVILNDFSEGLACYRFRVNDRFVLRGGLGSGPTRSGWDMGVFSDYVRAGKPVSAEARWVVFTGDFINFERHYQALPQYQALWRDPQRPQWLDDLVCDYMYVINGMEPFVNALQPQKVTGTIFFLNGPWGNWGPNHHDPNDRAPGMAGLAPGIRSSMPNLRISQYNNYLFDTGSDIYKQHPEYGVRDREGQLIASGINSDSTRSSSFFWQMHDPKVQKHLLTLHRDKIRQWKQDFLYTDGPGWGAEVIDWGSLSVAQSYDWLNYEKELRDTLRAVNPEEVIFMNGTTTPYTDIGYIEFRNPEWQNLISADWRGVALGLLTAKVDEAPGFTIVPTYGEPGADPAMSAYDIMYGWCGHLRTAERIPWMRAAWEYRGARLVGDAAEPRWWRDHSETEAYGLHKGSVALVNVINHAPKATGASVTVDTKKLGLTRGQPLYAYILQMNQPPTLDPDPKDTTKQVLTVHATTAMTPQILFWGKPCPATLSLHVPTQPGLMTSVVLSPIPAIVENVYGRPTETGIVEQRDVTISNAPSGALKISCRTDQATVLLPMHSLADTDVVSPYPVADAVWCGQPALRVTVKHGVCNIRLLKKNVDTPLVTLGGHTKQL